MDKKAKHMNNAVYLENDILENVHPINSTVAADGFVCEEEG